VTITVAAPDEQRFTAFAGTTVQATGAAGTFNLTVAANRLTASGTFNMPSVSGTITVTAGFEAIPGTVLARLVRTQDNATAINNTNPETSHFLGTGGIYADSFQLTAWDNNQQVLIGFAGTGRTPVVFNNGSLTGTRWRPSSEAGVGTANAPAFQMRFPTQGYENITLSARQKSTGSGPNAFYLAYRIGSTGNTWTRIEGSERNSFPRVSNDTYSALNTPAAETYINFQLPAAINDQTEHVYLRVVFDGLANLTGGNTSINNIEIRGLASGSVTFMPVTFNLNDGNIGGNTSSVIRNVAEGYFVTNPPAPVRLGFVLDGWRDEQGNLVSFSTLNITSPRTFTANWHRLGAVSNDTGLVSSADATWIAQQVINNYFTPTGPATARERLIADIDENGVIDLSDVVMLMRWLVGFDLSWLRANSTP